ncbi:hypothetical protein [Microcoleus sp. herbarium14]|uniref:hypothetical protein n=1 Tax=Microcoleus sp. herbarium14 TaxID=3055439 RepID=UPI002FD0D6DF
MQTVKLNNHYPIAADIYYQVITNVAGQSQQPSGHNRIKGGGFYDFRWGLAIGHLGPIAKSPST